MPIWEPDSSPLTPKTFFLYSFMKTPEYMKIPVKFIPDDIIKKYNINALEHKGYVYIKIKRDMYGLKQAAWLAYGQLREYLQPYGYLPDPNHQGIWYHTTKRTRFCLCVDDFGIKYYDKADAEHLLNILRKYYKALVDWEGRNYCGLTINWDYDRKFVDISMPKYIEYLLHKCQHNPSVPTYTPFKWTVPQYGKTQQFAKPTDTAPKLDKKGIKYVQSVIGSLLYYGRAVDPTILVALNELSTEQASPTTNTLQKIKQLLNYVATYPNTILQFHASDMTLHVDSDAAYLVLPNAKSRIAGYFYLSNHPKFHIALKLNAPVIVECRTLRHVVASAAETETRGLFLNARTTLPIREMLHTLGHPQPPTPIKTDNSTANDFVSKNLKQKRSKSWDMRYHWLRDRSLQQQFKIYWDKGINNWADYFTKHHSTKYHKVMRPKYIHMANLIGNVIINSQKVNKITSTSWTPRECDDLMVYTGHSYSHNRRPNPNDVKARHVISLLERSRPIVYKSTIAS